MPHAAFFPGSFDPPTLGHLNLIERAAQLFERVYVGIGLQTAKGSSLFTGQERLEMLKEITAHLPQVEVTLFSGLAVDFIQKYKIAVTIRGVRSCKDFDYEREMAQANRMLGGVETLLIPTDPKFLHIRSSLIREIGGCGHSLCQFIPEAIEDRVRKRLIQN